MANTFKKSYEFPTADIEVWVNFLFMSYQIGIWTITEDGIECTHHNVKIAVLKEHLQAKRDNEYYEMLIHCAEKNPTFEQEVIHSLNTAFIYSFHLYNFGLELEILIKTIVKQYEILSEVRDEVDEIKI